MSTEQKDMSTEQQDMSTEQQVYYNSAEFYSDSDDDPDYEPPFGYDDIDTDDEDDDACEEEGEGEAEEDDEGEAEGEDEGDDEGEAEEDDEEDDEGEDEDEDEDEEGEADLRNVPTVVIVQGNYQSTFNQKQNKGKRGKESITQNFSKADDTYWQSIDESKRQEYAKLIEDINNPVGGSCKVPLRFKILSSDITDSAKALVLTKLDHFQTMADHTGEYFKLRNWLTALDNLPLGFYKPLQVPAPIDFLTNVRRTLDETVYGHIEAKNQILKILAQWISNPSAQGHCIGIQGPMGVGKTSLIKDGLSKALNLPFVFIALGGASDGALLEGHNFTYEGSSYGKICEALMKAKCMNPIMFFDELDKISSTSRGEEVSSILTHLTDSTQNDKFSDRYFGEIDINLSKVLMIFSYNDESMINPILKDRMVTIRVPGYTISDKVAIAKDYLIPKILSQYLMQPGDIIFTNEIIQEIISKLAQEQGVRGLKRGIESIVSWINMFRYLPPPASGKRKREDYTFPLTVCSDHITSLLNKSDLESSRSGGIISTMYL